MAEGMDQPHAKPGFWLKARNPDLPRCREVGCPADTIGRCTSTIDDPLLGSIVVETVCEVGCPSGLCPTIAECSPLEGCSHGGVENCTEGYWKDRCSDCADRFFRLEGRCEPCPEKVIPFWVYIVGGFSVLLGTALFLEYIWSNTRLRKLGASQMGQLTVSLPSAHPILELRFTNC
eukprot:COSAG06_NODE_1265_length_10064_cov_8.150828_12_plen_176_part_00